MNALQSFLLRNGVHERTLTAYVELVSKVLLSEVVACLSRLFGLEFRASAAFDECAAFVATVKKHDVTILQAPDDISAGRFELMIEPGHLCEVRGEAADLSRQLSEWLSKETSDFDRIEPIC